MLIPYLRWWDIEPRCCANSCTLPWVRSHRSQGVGSRKPRYRTQFGGLLELSVPGIADSNTRGSHAFTSV